MKNQEENKDNQQQNGEKSHEENQNRNQGAWNGQVENDEQDPTKQGGSLASDGLVSESKAGRGADLTDTEEKPNSDRR